MMMMMAISYLKINRWWWILRFYSHHTGFYFWRRTEIILANLSKFWNTFYLLLAVIWHETVGCYISLKIIIVVV